MSLISNLQSFSPDASGTLVSDLVDTFKAGADTVLIGGRDITLHLPPAKTPCPSGCKFNSMYQRYIGEGGALCRVCKGEGFIYEPRQTVYRANIRWTDEPVFSTRSGGEDTPAGKVFDADVRTKTVIESFNHIQQAESANIDGVKCSVWQEPRQTGFGGTLLYVVTWWKRSNKKIGNG